MTSLKTTFASAAAGLVMLGNNALAQGFFERPYIARPPADIPAYRAQPVRPAPLYRNDTVMREDLPPPANLVPQDQKSAGSVLCDEALKARFCIPKPETVADPRNLAEGQITIVDDEKFLYLSLGNGQAVRYKVATAIAREKMPQGDYILSSLRGGEKIAEGKLMYGMIKNPRWCPTDNIRMQRGLPEGYCVAGNDPENPFGGVALYLAYMKDGKEVQTLFRIHGTTQPEKIGNNVSSGCVRMYTPDANDLFARVLDMRLRNIMIGIHVPQGPTREEYAANQRKITARIQQKYGARYSQDPFYEPRYTYPRRQSNFFEQLFRF